MELPEGFDARELDELLAHLPDFVMVVGRDATIRYLNRVEAEFDRSEVIGMSADDIPDTLSAEVFRAALERVLETGEAEEYEAVRTTADGSRRWYRSRMLPFRSGAPPEAVMVIATDVTELKRAQERIEHLHRLTPVCAWCDRIQDDTGRWVSLEAYVEEESGRRVTHGLCPDCRDRQLAALDEPEGREEADGDAA